VLHGTHDPLVPVANVAFMQTQLRGARELRTVLLEGANHFLPWNAVATVREALRDALESGC
jgi:pimeloyl-ACP methyl ester carboxylesterase